MHSIALHSPSLNRAVETKLFDRADRAVKGDPRHDLGVGELAPAAADLPNPLIRLFPNRLKMLDEGALQRPGCGVRRKTHAPRLVQGIEHLAKHVELKLVSRGIAYPNRCGTLVALEPGHLVFEQPPFPRNAVHDLHLPRRPSDGTQQPIAPGCRLLQEAGVQKCVQR